MNKHSFYLFVAAVIWGVAFVAQSVGMDHVGPFTFNAVRNLIGAVVLLPCIAILDRVRAKDRAAETGTGRSEGKKLIAGFADPMLWQGGLVTGMLLVAAGNLQQVGIKYTTVGKAGFITAMYIVLVPLLGLFLRRKVGAKVWAAVALAVIGLYLLSMRGTDFRLEKGDLYVLLSALAFAFQITAVDYYAARTDGVRLAWMEFTVCGLVTAVLMFLLEQPSVAGILAAGGPILYAGVLSCGVAYTCQILGQRDTDPTIASLIMSLEAVISVLAGWLILGQTMSGREIAGCVVMFAAILLAQL